MGDEFSPIFRLLRRAARHSLTEQWCKELDNRQIFGLVSMDLKKLSTIYLPHELTSRNLENMLLKTKPELLLCNLH